MGCNLIRQKIEPRETKRRAVIYYLNEGFDFIGFENAQWTASDRSFIQQQWELW